MNGPLQMGGNPHLTAFSHNWGWFLIWGIVLFSLGVFAIYFTTFTTLLSVVFLGFVIFAGGIVIILDSFSFWWRKWRGFTLHILMGLLYAIVGLMLINSPIFASVSLTFLLAVFYIALGLFRIFYSMSLSMPKWGWTLFNGIVALLLGVLILAEWPASSLFIIGLFVGIDLLIVGWGYIMAAVAGRMMFK